MAEGTAGSGITAGTGQGFEILGEKLLPKERKASEITRSYEFMIEFRGAKKKKRQPQNMN